MSKEMIISSSAHETRVAILEDDQVAEIFIERERSRGVVGNVYKGRVSKVLPGMQSAFVDLGLERDGFLYVTDVVASLEELDRFETEEEDVPAAPLGATGNGAATGQRRDRPSSHGGRREREKGPEPKIEELLKEGQEIIVQVAKEPLGTKGARLTSHATMQGVSWCSCRLSITSACRARLNRARSGRACGASSATSASKPASLVV